NHGALPSVFNIEIDWITKIRNVPFLIGFYVGQTWQSLAFSLPANSVAIVVSASIWKNTMMGLEYRHDTNYSRMAPLSVTGHGLPVPGANVGGSRDIVTFQVGAYF